MSEDVYFVQVEGGGEAALKQMADTLGETETDATFIVTTDEIEPINEDTFRDYIRELADAAGVELAE